MKQFFQIMAKDILKENFTRRELAVYGILAPVAIVAVCLFASLFE